MLKEFSCAATAKQKTQNPVKLQRVLSLAQRRGDHFAQATWAEMRHLGKKKKRLGLCSQKKTKREWLPFSVTQLGGSTQTA